MPSHKLILSFQVLHDLNKYQRSIEDAFIDENSVKQNIILIVMGFFLRTSVTDNHDLITALDQLDKGVLLCIWLSSQTWKRRNSEIQLRLLNTANLFW